MSRGGKIACWAVLLLPLGCGVDASAPRTEPDVSSVAQASSAPPAVIVDTDMDFDDVAAIAYLCQEHKRGHIDLRAVTVTNDGAGLPGHAIQHARCALARCGLTSIPVADGAPTGAHAFPLALRTSVETVLSTVFLGCTESSAPSAIPAEQLLVSAVAQSTAPVRLVTLGPLTNVANAVHLGGPTFVAQIERATVMAGAVHVPGNLVGEATLFYNNSQELNAWADPAATATVLSSFAPVLDLVPLDATEDVPVTQAFVTRLAADQQTAEAALVYAIASHPLVLPGVIGGLAYWWDPLAAVASTHDGIVAYALEPLVVVQSGASSGRTAASGSGTPTHVGNAADAPGFEDVFIDTLNGR